jgi:hypothetical protein
MKTIDLSPAILANADPTARAIVDLARIVNINAAILNKFAFSYQDYAVIGYRS